MTTHGSELQVVSSALRTAANAVREVSHAARTASDEIDAIMSGVADAMSGAGSAAAAGEYAAGWKGGFRLELGRLSELGDKLDLAADGYDGSDKSAAKRLDSL